MLFRSNPSIQQHLPTMSRRCAQVILEGMFDPSLGIEPNVQDYLSLADITGLSAAIDEMHKDGLQGNDFSKSAQKRQALRQYCIEQLHALRSETGVDISIPSAAQPTGSILAVHIPQKDGKSIAKQLSDAGVFISFIAGDQKHPPFNILRISFQFDTTIEEIDICIGTLKGVLRQ